MGLLFRFIIKIGLNAALLYFARQYLPGFHMEGGTQTLVLAAVVLALLYSIIRPFLRLVTAPLVWITFGFFNVVINIVLLLIADSLLPHIAINDIYTLAILSFGIAIVNIL